MDRSGGRAIGERGDYAENRDFLVLVIIDNFSSKSINNN